MYIMYVSFVRVFFCVQPFTFTHLHFFNYIYYILYTNIIYYIYIYTYSSNFQNM